LKQSRLLLNKVNREKRPRKRQQPQNPPANSLQLRQSLKRSPLQRFPRNQRRRLLKNPSKNQWLRLSQSRISPLRRKVQQKQPTSQRMHRRSLKSSLLQKQQKRSQPSPLRSQSLPRSLYQKISLQRLQISQLQRRPLKRRPPQIRPTQNHPQKKLQC
jgi:hypothetical protein